jgi:hypothetical protein
VEKAPRRNHGVGLRQDILKLKYFRMVFPLGGHYKNIIIFEFNKNDDKKQFLFYQL